MQYNFETVPKRYHCGSAKWDEMERAGLTSQDDIIPFSVADMELETAPEIVEGLQKFIKSMPLGYANTTDAFRTAVCEWQQKRHGWRPKEEWILTTHGVIDAFFEAVRTFTQEGEGVLLLTPVYYPMYFAAQRNGRTLVDCPLVRKGTRYEIDFADFEEKAARPETKLFILCSPHNPCSRVWTPEELKRLGEICLRHQVYVVADEIHADLIMPGYRHTSFLSLDEPVARNCMLCVAPSKTFNLAGLQTSMVLIPDEEKREQFRQAQLRQTGNPKCNILGYEACRIAYEQCEGWLDEVIGLVAENKRVVEDFFAREFPEIRLMDFEATYLLWMDWSGLGLPAKELERINRQEARLFFDEGYVFGQQGECFERWNLACPTRYVREALERMKKAYAPYRNKQP